MMFIQSLGLSIQLPTNVRYFYDGEVDSVLGHYRKLVRQYGAKEDPNAVSNNNMKGMCSPAFRFFDKCNSESGMQFGIHVFFESHGEPVDTFLRGHEETHLLQKLSLDRVLEKALETRGVCVDHEETDIEVFANLGGIYALERVGKTPEDVVRFLSKSEIQNRTGFFQSLCLYRQKQLEAGHEIEEFKELQKEIISDALKQS